MYIYRLSIFCAFKEKKIKKNVDASMRRAEFNWWSAMKMQNIAYPIWWSIGLRKENKSLRFDEDAQLNQEIFDTLFYK